MNQKTLMVLTVAGLFFAQLCYAGVVHAGKKIFFINSYHDGYAWSDGIRNGIKDVFKGADIELKVHDMDTKRNTSEEFKSAAGVKTKEMIEAFQPEVIIAADDNASKYVIVPYFNNSSTPVVFCGVNWSASEYGFPSANVTGMVEVSLIPKLVNMMTQHSKGEKIGLLGADNLSNRKEVANYKKIFNINFEKEVFVTTIEDWKNAFAQLQQEVDMLIMAPPSFFNEVSEEEKSAIKNFILEHVTIPTGSVEDWIAPYALISLAKRSQEQGEWAATTALRILDGTAPSDIPIVENEQGSIILNLVLAEKLNVFFSPSTLRNATIIDKEN